MVLSCWTCLEALHVGGGALGGAALEELDFYQLEQLVMGDARLEVYRRLTRDLRIQHPKPEHIPGALYPRWLAGWPDI